ncbi:alpha/beta fold hydrolase [Spirillospora sp. NPDC047279]|uniref:alpha/beta fold hydrolase n=1 Tax=Spirillospora sp. NPDC047279 TaxID=3155478 RepID=UPI0034016EAB
MTNTRRTVTSLDGTTIAFEQAGTGPAVILVASALADRSDTAKLARLLAPRFTVINYDRRGRGASGDATAYAVEREIEDIHALIDHAGGSASLFGSSSGAVLALRAAAEPNVERLALYEPPFAVTPGGFGPPPGFARHIASLLAEDDRGRAVTYFMTEAQGMPAFMVNAMRLVPGPWSKLKAMAHTLPYDIAVMGDTQQGKPLAPDPWSKVTAPALVLTGGKSPTGFHDAARALTGILPDARHRTLPGLHHGAVVMAPKKLAPALADFLAP